MNPTLYSFRRCPYAMRARMALISSGTPFDLVEVKLSAKPEALLAASPKATVPVLVVTVVLMSLIVTTVPAASPPAGVIHA